MTIAEKGVRILDFLRSERVRGFFDGRLYPVIIALLVLFGSVTSLEIYTNLAAILLVSAGLVFARTEKPIIMFGCSFLFQMSLEHSPGYQAEFSDYYFTGHRLVIIVISAVILFCAMLYCFIVNRRYESFSLKTPMLLPLAFLSIAFLLNGAFSSAWIPESLLYGALQVLIYVGLFFYFYLSFAKTSGKELVRYFTYVSSLLALLLFVRVCLTFALAYFADGEVLKEDMVFGFGTWNTAGVCLTVLIPVCFLGAVGEKMQMYYLATAVAALAGAMLTMSRNAQLFGCIVFACCFLVCCFVGKYKKIFRILTAIGILGALAVCVLFKDKLWELVGNFFWDNGRYLLWQTGIDNFLSSPLCGVGFYGFDLGNPADEASAFFPAMAHQTVVQILSAMGIVGGVCYGVYRVFTLLPFLQRPKSDKIFMLISVLTLLGESMLDNYIFYFLPVIYYSLTLAIAHIRDEEEKTLCKEHGKEQLISEV